MIEVIVHAIVGQLRLIHAIVHAIERQLWLIETIVHDQFLIILTWKLRNIRNKYYYAIERQLRLIQTIVHAIDSSD